MFSFANFRAFIPSVIFIANAILLPIICYFNSNSHHLTYHFQIKIFFTHKTFESLRVYSNRQKNVECLLFSNKTKNRIKTKYRSIFRNENDWWKNEPRESRRVFRTLSNFYEESLTISEKKKSMFDRVLNMPPFK